MELKELILGLRGLILSLRGLILGLRGLILGLRGLILGLRGLIWGLRGASGGDVRTDVRTYGRTYGRLEIHPCVLQDIGPLGPLPKKHISEHNCSSVRVFLSILAHLAHLAVFFFLIFNGINKCFDGSM